MTKASYLYGDDVDTAAWEDMAYKEVLLLKIQLAHANIETLNKIHYMERDTVRVNDCVRAVKFNDNLLVELKGQV